MQQAVNIYFKPWNQEPEIIKDRLKTHNLKFSFDGAKFFVKLESGKKEYIRSLVEAINKDNEAMIFESDIDFTFYDDDQVEKCYLEIEDQKQKAYKFKVNLDGDILGFVIAEDGQIYPLQAVEPTLFRKDFKNLFDFNQPWPEDVPVFGY